MFIYDIDELATIYDTLEFLNQTYNITVSDIRKANSVEEVKRIVNKTIKELLKSETNKSKINQLKKYILKV